jgi:hypothetical protein
MSMDAALIMKNGSSKVLPSLRTIARHNAVPLKAFTFRNATMKT